MGDTSVNNQTRVGIDCGDCYTVRDEDRKEMADPHLEEDIQKKLIQCNRMIPEGNHYIIPFICAAAVPHGRLFHKDLESNLTVSDTFIALVNYTDTNCFALTMMKFALERSGCARETIQELCDACRKAGSRKYPEYDLHVFEKEPFFEKFQFHKMLVDVSDALTGDERRRMINLGSAFIERNLTHTDSLLIHFLRLIHGDVIGPGKVSKIKQWLKAIQRQDIISAIDELNTVSLPGGQLYAAPVEATLPQELNTESPPGGLYPAPVQETRGIHLGIEEQGGVNGLSQMQQSQRFLGLSYGVSVHTTEPHLVEVDNPLDTEPQGTAENGKLTDDISVHKTEVEQPRKDINMQETIEEDDQANLISVHKREHDVDKPWKDTEAQETAEVGNQTGQVVKSKQLSAIPCIMAFGVLIGVLMITSAAIFAWLEAYPTMNGQVFLRSGEAVVVQQNGFDPFHYTSMLFTKNHFTENGYVQLYMQSCRELMANSRAIHTNVTHINQSIDESSKFRIGSYYLVTGSEVVFNVNITAHTELPICSAALYIFQDYDSYSNFLADGSDTGKARQICLIISNETLADHHPSYSFIANETSYYFIGLSVARGSEGVDDIYYQATGTQLFYTTGNLSLACSIVPGTSSSCCVPLADSEPILILGSTKCFLAVTDSNDGLYLNYSSLSTRNPLHNIARITTGLVALPLFFSLIVVTTIISIRLFSVSRYRHKHYTL